MEIFTFETPQDVAESFADRIMQQLDSAVTKFQIALSGGSTPQILFKHWASFNEKPDRWNRMHFYWGDERCVPPGHADSNYGVANQLFFSPACINPSRIHRVLGEDDPAVEAQRYAELLQSQLPNVNGLPQFDVVILGMGTDGHTASIFPDQMQLLDDDRICAVATHPETGQQRVTLTGPVIANAKQIVFLITGHSKKEKFAAIENQSIESQQWPAARFFHLPNTKVYIDRLVVELR